MNCGASRRTLTDGTDMPQLVVLPRRTVPGRRGDRRDARQGICDNLLDNGIEIEHACEVVHARPVTW
jgi:ferredoxin